MVKVIPVTFNKDDLNNEKKGTIRAQDLASMVGLLYPDKIGILNMFEEEPARITNVDLVTTGYVKLTFNKAYVVAYGRLIYIEQDELVTFELPTTTTSGNLGIRINLADSGSHEVEWFAKAGTLRQDNLLNNASNGVCEIALYSYTATSTTFRLDGKVVKTIPSLADYLAGANFTTPVVSDNSNKLATTAFVQSLITANSPTYQAYTFGGANYGYILRLGRMRIYGGIAHAGGSRRQGTISLPETLSSFIGISLTANVNNDADYDNTAKNATVAKRSYTYNSVTFSTSSSDVDVDFLIVGVV